MRSFAGKRWVPHLCEGDQGQRTRLDPLSRERSQDRSLFLGVPLVLGIETEVVCAGRSRRKGQQPVCLQPIVRHSRRGFILAREHAWNGERSPLRRVCSDVCSQGGGPCAVYTKPVYWVRTPAAVHRHLNSMRGQKNEKSNATIRGSTLAGRGFGCGRIAHCFCGTGGARVDRIPARSGRYGPQSSTGGTRAGSF